MSYGNRFVSDIILNAARYMYCICNYNHMNVYLEKCMGKFIIEYYGCIYDARVCMIKLQHVLL